MKDSPIISRYLNRYSPVSQEDNSVIQYGLELLLDSSVKIAIIQIVGIICGKGIETFVVLSVFCSLRLQAGGYHAHTGVGCFIYMAAICTLCLVLGSVIQVKVWHLICFFTLAEGVLLRLAPGTINREYFTVETVNRKKAWATLLLVTDLVIAIACTRFRSYILLAVTSEALTLLPLYKTKRRREEHEKEDCRKGTENVDGGGSEICREEYTGGDV